jgi:hypothetical protein
MLIRQSQLMSRIVAARKAKITAGRMKKSGIIG